MRHTHWLTAKRRPEPSVPLADDQYAAMLRAALPHLLRAVTDEMLVLDLATEGGSGEPYVGIGDTQVSRRLLLAALTDAAGRI